MPKQSIETLKSYFNTGDKPTEQQFADLIDSFLHKDSTKEVQVEFENKTSVTIEHNQGIRRRYTVYVNNQEVSADITDDGNTAIINFGEEPQTGVIIYSNK